MIRKHVLTVVFVVVGAMLLAGIAVQSPSNQVMAQEGQPGAALAPAVDVGGTFTYQGLIQQSGVAFDGSCDFQFGLFDALTVGTQVGATQTQNGQTVSKGRFTTVLDFGANAFNGQARWLQIAARCPSGSGSFTTLTPRQPLTAAPYALSLQPGAVIAGNVSSSAGILNLTNNGSGNGVTVNSAANGLQVLSASGNGVQVDSAARGVFVVSASASGLRVGSANTGVLVNSANASGVQVDSAVLNGVLVGSAGIGVQVQSAVQEGVRVGSAATGVQVDSASGIGVAVGSAPRGVHVASASLAGVQVDQSDLGVFVANARNGFLAQTARENGVQVNSAVNGMRVLSATGNGVQVDSAGVGVWVDSTTGGGIFVRSAGTVGLQVQSALNGVQVDNATGIGVAVGSAANGVVVNAATSWAGFFNGPVSAKTCTGCALAAFGINTGAAALAPGDIVAIQGTRPGGTTGQPMLMEVDQVTQAGAPVVGVVYGRGELVTNVGTDGKTTTQLVPREGAAKPGDYVHIVIYGPAQVKASALGKTIAVGDKLAVDSSGAARGLKTVEVSGVQLAESAPTIGMAMESQAASKNGLIWVLVNPK